MAVDKLREQFHINRVSPDLIQDFLTAQTYREEITIAKQKILSLNNKLLQSVCSTPIQQGKSPSYINDNGLLCIKPKQTQDLLVSLDGCDNIDPSTSVAMEKQKLKNGDIVITRSGAGTIGRASLYLQDQPVYTNDHLFIVRADKADNCYIGSYLRSYWGERLLESGISGSTGQLNLSNEHIKKIPLYLPSSLAQKYIGDKVRQAERLRDWGTSSYQTAQESFQKIVAALGYNAKASKKYVWTTLDNRLDPAYYDPKYSFLGEQWFANSSQPLSKYIVDGSYGVLPDSNSYGSGNQRFIRATDIHQSNIDPSAFTWVPADQVAPKAKINTGDILLEVKGAIQACELASLHLNGTYVNGSIYRFTPKDIFPGYLTFYLRAFIKQLYCERVSVNNIISYLDLASIATLPILRLEVEQENYLGEAYINQLEAARFTFALTKAARLLIEALIEGQITEDELIHAQQALEAGNTEPDVAILRRLKGDGLDGKGQPLFSDLEQLYNLLRQADQDRE